MKNEYKFRETMVCLSATTSQYNELYKYNRPAYISIWYYW